MSKQPFRYQPTQEQRLLADARKAQRAKAWEEAQQNIPKAATSPAKIIKREWLPVMSKNTNAHLQATVLTWNMLAQCLVRRDLFPVSDCLRASQRGPMLHAELLAYQTDIMCLQEVDREEDLMLLLERVGYKTLYASAPSKKHGCMIAYKGSFFESIGHKVIEYDKQELHLTGGDAYRRGGGYYTRNIGLINALRYKRDPSKGIVIVTTHLFWHPRYIYERARQTYILLRETLKFGSEKSLEDWPCIFAGDFNFHPGDVTYSLLFRDSLLSSQKQALMASRVVHTSVDPSVPITPRPADIGAEENDGDDPDKIITSARPATAADGLLSIEELQQRFDTLPKVRSAYDTALGSIAQTHAEIKTYASRRPEVIGRHGQYEPAFSSYAFHWQTVIDYIFILDPGGVSSNVISLLSPHKEEDLAPGLPRSGVCGSDHIALGADISWGNHILNCDVRKN